MQADQYDRNRHPLVHQIQSDHQQKHTGKVGHAFPARQYLRHIGDICKLCVTQKQPLKNGTKAPGDHCQKYD